MRSNLENKVNQTEFHSEISNLSLKMDEMQKDFQKKTQNFASLKELNSLNNQMENKANLSDVNDALNTKANKESVINALHRKANKNEIEAVLKNKIELEELQNIINILNNKPDYSELEKIGNLLEQKTDKDEFIAFNNLLNSKVEIKDFENFKNLFNEDKFEKNKKIEEMDHDIDRLIENIKKEFGNMNVILNNFDMKKIDIKEFEKLNISNCKKIDEEFFNENINTLKNNYIEMLDNLKNENGNLRKKLEEEFEQKLNSLEKNIDKYYEEGQRSKEKINDLFEQRKNDQDEMIKLTKNVLSNTQKDILEDLSISRNEVQRCVNDVQELFNKKMDKKEFDFFKNKFNEVLGLKVFFFLYFLKIYLSGNI